MPREIKFRVFDKRLRMMSIVSIIEWDKINPEIPIYIRGRLISHIAPDLLKQNFYQEWQTGGETETLEAIKVEDCVLMQFTGLKDKNGKEIWEGDIVQMPTQWWHEGVDIRIKREYRPKKNELVEAPIGNNLFCAGDWSVNRDECEVIGNLYENPDLMPREEAMKRPKKRGGG